MATNLIPSRPFTIFAYYIDLPNPPPTITSVASFIKNILVNPNNFTNGISTVIASNNLGHDFEMRNVALTPSGESLRGTLSRVREDRPPVRDANRTASTLYLPQGSNLLEENYFEYFFQSRLLLWHFNLRANFPNNFAQLLSLMIQNNQIFIAKPVIKNINYTVGCDIDLIEFAVSPPRKPLQQQQIDAVDPSAWQVFNPVKALQAAAGSRLSAQISTRGKLQNSKVWDFILGLQSLPVTRKLRIRLEDADEPIDLITSRFKHITRVNIDHVRNPIIPSIWAAFDAAKAAFDAP